MQHFKFENWRIGGLENSIFDVTNRLFSYENNYLPAWRDLKIIFLDHLSPSFSANLIDEWTLETPVFLPYFWQNKKTKKL